MKLKIVVAPPVQPAGWHGDLAARLRQTGHEVHFSIGSHAQMPSSLALLRRFESLVGRGSGPASDAPVGPIEAKSSAADLTIDLTGDPQQRNNTRLVPLCDGVPGLVGLAAALLEGRSPELSVVRVEPGASEGCIVVSGRAAIQRPKRFGFSFDAVCARLCDLLVAAVRWPADGESAGVDAAAPDITYARAGKFAVASLASHVVDKIEPLILRPDHWSVGWRRLTTNDAVSDRLCWPKASYSFLPDDGERFYADPFAFAQGQTTWLFMEEFPYATGKGIISACAIDAGGTVSTPRPVLEAECHLSYPHVFARDGSIWMIPETSGNRTIELYRATRFPDSWRREAVLVDDIDASDATLVEHQGRLWLFAALHPGNASSRDGLALFHAPALTGPWQAHPANPVLVDASAARPAGALFRHGSHLWRPAQDCTNGYGGGLTLCRVDALDPERYAQTAVTRLSPHPDWGANGVHTLNTAGTIETIDRVSAVRRF